MGNMVTQVAPRRAGDTPPSSQGGVRYEIRRGRATMGATYATGGDSMPTPATISGYTLDEVRITSTTGLPAGVQLQWDGGIAPPKIFAYDPATGTHAQLANASAALAAVVVRYEYVYISGV
jgi:hypothetical protein